jgi:methionine sulfoxide reductase catalytic subunit
MNDSPDIPESEITSPANYQNRRTFMRAAAVAGSLLATGTAYRLFNPVRYVEAVQPPVQGIRRPSETPAELLAEGWRVPEELTPEANILHYNNFYEFTTSKQDVAYEARNFRTDIWKLTFDGLVDRTRT